MLVPKKDSSLSFCIDFRNVNTVSKFDADPMSWVDKLRLVGRIPVHHYSGFDEQVLTDCFNIGLSGEDGFFYTSWPILF